MSVWDSLGKQGTDGAMLGVRRGEEARLATLAETFIGIKKEGEKNNTITQHF